MSFYNIRKLNGTMVREEPCVGKWYCHVEKVGYDGEEQHERTGNLGWYGGMDTFLDENNDRVEMFSDDWPDFLAEQY